MVGGVIIPCLDLPRRRRFHLSREASSDSPLSMAAPGLTRQPSSASRPKNKSNRTHLEEKRGRKAKKSLDDVKVEPQSKSQTRREICRRTRATRDVHQSSSSSSLQRNNLNQADEDERLGEEAKMAKKRLDKRLRPYLQSQIKREISPQRNQVIQAMETKFWRGSFNWIPTKTSEQENCGVCLEELRNDSSLDCLPCGHKFHSHCLRPWLQINPHCPYCRTNTNPQIILCKGCSYFCCIT